MTLRHDPIITKNGYGICRDMAFVNYQHRFGVEHGLITGGGDGKCLIISGCDVVDTRFKAVSDSGICKARAAHKRTALFLQGGRMTLERCPSVSLVQNSGAS